MQQIIDNEVTDRSFSEFDFRVISANTIDYTNKCGWYLDLKFGATGQGERLTSPPGVVFDRVIFETIIPSGNQCKSGGGWLMELDLNSGARTGKYTFDINMDDKLDNNNLYAGATVSGLKAPEGMPNEHFWMKTNKNGVAVKQICQSSSKIWTVRNRDASNPPVGRGGTVDRIYLTANSISYPM